jgi:hypothetical protein
MLISVPEIKLFLCGSLWSDDLITFYCYFENLRPANQATGFTSTRDVIFKAFGCFKRDADSGLPFYDISDDCGVILRTLQRLFDEGKSSLNSDGRVYLESPDKHRLNAKKRHV